MERITKLPDKNLSQLRYEETVTRRCLSPLSCPSTILGYSCFSCAICDIIHGLLYLYSFQVWIFADWNNFGCYRCYNEILVTFANFAKLADHKRSLFTFILLRNLLFLRHWLAFSFLTQSFHIARKSLVTFAIFAKFADFSKLFLALSFCKCRIFNCRIYYSCYFCHIYYSIFSHSKKKSCYFCDFCEIRGLLEALLGPLFL